jgi:transcription antitermination factor NusG
VNQALQRRSYETFLPTCVEFRHYSDRLKKVEAPMFPGYLFCRLEPHARLPVLKTPGVEYVLGAEGVPQPVDESEIAGLRKLMESGFAARAWPFLKAGQKVRVEVGAMEGVEGILMRDKGNDRLILSVTVLQRSVCVEMDRAWIRPI